MADYPFSIDLPYDDEGFLMEIQGDPAYSPIDRKLKDIGFPYEAGRSRIRENVAKAREEVRARRKKFNEAVEAAFKMIGGRRNIRAAYRAHEKGKYSFTKAQGEFSLDEVREMLAANYASDIPELSPYLTDEGELFKFLGSDLSALSATEKGDKPHPLFSQLPGDETVVQAIVRTFGTGDISQYAYARTPEEIDPSIVEKAQAAADAASIFAGVRESSSSDKAAKRKEKSSQKSLVRDTLTAHLKSLRREYRDDVEGMRFEGVEEGQQAQLNAQAVRNISRVLGAPILGEVFNQVVRQPEVSAADRRAQIAARRRTYEETEDALRDKFKKVIQEIDEGDLATEQVKAKLRSILTGEPYQDTDFPFGPQAVDIPPPGGSGGGKPPSTGPGGMDDGGEEDKGPFGLGGRFWRRFSSRFPAAASAITKYGPTALATAALPPVSARVGTTAATVATANTGGLFGGSPAQGARSLAGTATFGAVAAGGLIGSAVAGPLGSAVGAGVGAVIGSITHFGSEIISVAEKIEENTRKDLFASPQALMESVSQDIQTFMKRIEEAGQRDETLASIIAANGRLERAIEDFKTAMLDTFGPLIATVTDVAAVTIDSSAEILDWTNAISDLLNNWMWGQFNQAHADFKQFIEDKLKEYFGVRSGIQREIDWFFDPDHPGYAGIRRQMRPNNKKVPRGVGNPF